MKNYFSILALALLLALSSCGGDEKEGTLKLDTKDVKGTIEAEGASVSTTELHSDEGEFEVPNVKLSDGCRFQISPTSKTFEEEWTRITNSIANFGGEMKEEKKVENGVFYHVKSEFAGKKEEGYNFVYYVKGKDKNYIIQGEGSNPFEPIADKAEAEKAFAAAQTFKPE